MEPSVFNFFFRFFCECVIWEVEYGRNWDFGGLLRDCSQANPHWLYPIWTGAVLPKPLPWPQTAPTTFTFIFSFPFIRHTLVIPHKFQIVNKQWSLREGLFSCCLRTYNVLKTLERFEWSKLASEASDPAKGRNHRINSSFCRGVDICSASAARSQIVSCCRISQWQQI